MKLPHVVPLLLPKGAVSGFGRPGATDMAPFSWYRFAAGTLLAGALVANASSAHAAAPAVDIDALVSHETRQVMASGITRVDTWQEHFVRRGHQVWTERVLPATHHVGHDHESSSGPIGHKHFNADTSARWLSLAEDGKVDVRFVDRASQTVVSVPAAEFGTVGFDGRYEAAASIVPPSVVRSMTAQPGGSPEGRWLTDRSDGWSHRVLWSESKQLALRVESQRDDGSVRRSVSVRLLPTASAARIAPPWAGLGGYAQKRYDDFMD